MSDDLKPLIDALIAFQRVMPAVPESGYNTFFKSKYSTMKDVVEVLKLANAHGLAIAQFPGTGEDGTLSLTTWLLHDSGQFLKFTAPVFCADRNDPQKAGSAISYMRKYAMMGALGLASEDDDGAGAAQPSTTTPGTTASQPPLPASPPPPPPPPPPGQTAEVRGRIDNVEIRNGESARGPWSMYALTLNGGRYATFDTTQGGVATGAHADGAEVVLTYETTPKGNNIKTLVRIDADAGAIIPPTTPGPEVVAQVAITETRESTEDGKAVFGVNTSEGWFRTYEVKHFDEAKEAQGTGELVPIVWQQVGQHRLLLQCARTPF